MPVAQHAGQVMGMFRRHWPHTGLMVAVVAAGAILLAYPQLRRGEAEDPATVKQQGAALASSVEVRLEWARFGATGTIVRISATDSAGDPAIVQFESLTLEGFEPGPVVLLSQDRDGGVVRLPRIDAGKPRRAVSIGRVAVASGERMEIVEGPWTVPLEPPPAEDWDAVFESETLGSVNFLDGEGEMSAVRTRAETLISYTLPPHLTPAGPPTLVNEDGSTVLAVELPAAATPAGSSRYYATAPPTEFGSRLAVRLGPLVDRTDEVRQASIDIATLAGHRPAYGESLELTLPPAGSDDQLRITGTRLYPAPDPQHAGGNLMIGVNAYLTGAAPVNAGVEIEKGTLTFLVADALGRPLRVMGVAGWTGSPPSGEDPGVPPGSEIDLLYGTENDISSITVTLFGTPRVIEVPDLLELAPEASSPPAQP